MKILHFSDSHAGAPMEDWSALFDKRWVGIFNYKFRRRFQHDQTLLRDAVNLMIRTDADLFVCTGDITSTGQEREFEITLDILRPLAKTKKLLYLPGNHDFYVFEEKCNQAMRKAFLELNNGRFSISDLPVKISFPECDIIAVNESWPSNLISSCGYLREKDSNIILAMLENKNKPIILVGHYPLIEKKPIQRIRHKLWGQDKIVDSLKKNKIDLSLCGHVHKPYHISTGENGRGEYCSGSVTKMATLSQINYCPEKDIFEHKYIEIKR